MADWPGLEARNVLGYVHVRDTAGHMHPDTLRRAARAHAWEQPHAGVVRLGPESNDPRNGLAAAVLRVRSNDPKHVTALTGWTALWLYGLRERMPSTTYLTSNHARRAPAVKLVRMRRSRTLSDRDVTTLDGLPVVTPARLFCDIAGSVSESLLRGFLIDARQRGFVAFAEIREALDRAGNVRGARRLRTLMDELEAERSDSVFEDKMRRKLERAGFEPDPGQAGVPVSGRTLHIDIPFSADKVGIECHGLGYHGDRPALETDAKRQSELNMTEWVILIATWNDLGPGWPEFRERVRRALHRPG